MIRKHAYITGVSVCFAFFVACSDDVTNVYENSFPDRVGKLKDLPKCDSEEEGALVYVRDSAKFFVCDDVGWTQLDGIKGDNGKDGENGKDGKNGKNGTDGKDGKDGKDGASCTVAALADSSGFKVLCGKDSVGIVKNGEKGDGCTLDDDGNGSVVVTCGKGNDATKTTLYKAVCGTTPYDPKSRFCANGKIYDLCGEKSFDPLSETCATHDSTYQVYKFVKIGVQTWMAENLNYKTATGSSCYDNKEANCAKYGRLYTWATAIGKSDATCGYGISCKLSLPVQGVCPKGWHIPSQEEFASLVSYLGGQSEAGKKLKSAIGWSKNGNGDGSSGFAGLPGGLKSNDDKFLNEGSEGYFWSASEVDDNHSNVMYLTDSDVGYLSDYAKVYSFSVRCKKNDN